MNNDSTEIYSDIFLTLGLDPFQGGAGFLKLLSIWVGVAGLTTFIVFQWSISNLAHETEKLCYNNVLSLKSPPVASIMPDWPPAGSKNFRLIKQGLAAVRTKVIHDPSCQKKQLVWIYQNGRLSSVATRMITRMIGDDSSLGSRLFQVRTWLGGMHTIMEVTIL
jgi:hypothetical protein